MGATPRLTNRKVPTSPDCHRGTPSNAECYPCNQSLPTPESTYLCDTSLSSSRGIQEAADTTSTSHSFILDVVSWLHRTFLYASAASLPPPSHPAWLHHLPPMSSKPPRKLWQHANPTSSAMWTFMQTANRKRGLNMQVSPVVHLR